MENYQGWDIDYKMEESGGFLSNRFTIKANILPNILEIYNYLRDNGKVKCNIDYIQDVFRDLEMEWPYNESFLDLTRNILVARSHAHTGEIHSIFNYSKDVQHDVNIFEELVKFRKANNHQTTQSSTSMIADWLDGDHTERKTLNKVKMWIDENLPDPKLMAIKYLQSKNAI